MNDTTIATAIDSQPLLLDVRNVTLHITSEQFDRLCIDNPDLRLEMTKDGKLIVIPPTFGESGKRNSSLNLQVGMWNEQTELGEVFDSSTGYNFTALGGGKLSPDVSWIAKLRLVGVSLKQFIPIAPDFIIELRSTTDSLSDVREKMLEYQRLGVKLGLLINPQEREVEIYRQGKEVEIISSPTAIDCNDVMPGFSLRMSKIW
jgi:Uma2 family endonuclease